MIVLINAAELFVPLGGVLAFAWHVHDRPRRYPGPQYAYAQLGQRP